MNHVDGEGRRTEDQLIAQAKEHFSEGLPTEDLTARIIAARWHSGQASPLYSFASCGATDDDDDARASTALLAEIDDNARNSGPDGFDEMSILRFYVERVGPRGPVPGWSNLSW